jgi:Protein of unknown function DUF86
LQIIGESAQGIPKDMRALEPEIPWQEIMVMRYALLHGYFEIDSDIVWDGGRLASGECAHGRVSVLLGHSSIKVTEKYYSPWVRARQEQLEADVRRSWAPPEHGTRPVA